MKAVTAVLELPEPDHEDLTDIINALDYDGDG